MANLILPSRFTQQPQYPVELNPQHWLADDLLFVHPMSGSFAFVDGVPTSPVVDTLPKSPFADVRGNSSEIAGVGDGSSYQSYLIPQRANGYGLTLSAWTWETGTNALGGETVLSLCTPSSQGGVNLRIGGGDVGAVQSITSIGLSGTASGTKIILDGVWHHLCGTITGEASRGIFVDGVSEATSTLSRIVPAVSVIAVGTYLLSGAYSNGLESGTRMSFPMVIRRILSANEVSRLYLEQRVNPWQLFRKRPQILYFDVGGGGATDLTVLDSTHAHTAEAVVLNTQTFLTVLDSTHGHTSETATLAQNSTLTVLDSTHAHTAEVSTVTESATTSLTVLDSAHGHTADAVAISTQTSVTVLDATHGHTVEVVVLNTQTTVVVMDSTHGHTAETVGVTQQSADETALTVLDSTHGHTAETVTLTTAISLVVLDSTHGHTAEDSTVTQQGDTTLTVLDSTHAHTASNVRLISSADQVAKPAGGGGTSTVSGRKRQKLIIVERVEDVEELLEQVEEIVQAEPKARKLKLAPKKPKQTVQNQPEAAFDWLSYYQAKLDTLRDQQRAASLKRQLDKNAEIIRAILEKQEKEARLALELQQEEEMMLLLMAA